MGIHYLQPPADGLFGENTRKAIKQFQGQFGVPQTGFLSNQQSEALSKSARQFPAANDQVAMLCFARDLMFGSRRGPNIPNLRCPSSQVTAQLPKPTRPPQGQVERFSPSQGGTASSQAQPDQSTRPAQQTSNADPEERFADLVVELGLFHTEGTKNSKRRERGVIVGEATALGPYESRAYYGGCKLTVEERFSPQYPRRGWDGSVVGDYLTGRAMRFPLSGIAPELFSKGVGLGVGGDGNYKIVFRYPDPKVISRRIMTTRSHETWIEVPPMPLFSEFITEADRRSLRPAEKLQARSMLAAEWRRQLADVAGEFFMNGKYSGIDISRFNMDVDMETGETSLIMSTPNLYSPETLRRLERVVTRLPDTATFVSLMQALISKCKGVDGGADNKEGSDGRVPK
jgi:peptidoglycan hydrolase-like protein with peptidoglycan-binding domain